MSDINENVTSLAKKIAGEMTYGDGVVDIPKETFEKSLEGSDITMNEWNKVAKHRDSLISAVTMAVGEEGIKQMKKDKKLESVTGTMKAGKDKIGATIHREKQVMDGKGGTTAKFGMAQAKYVANGAGGQKGELKKVRAKLSEEATKLFG